MADRVLTWHREGVSADNVRIGPTYYLEAEYEPVAVRIHAENAPSDDAAVFDIKADGVSIFNSTIALAKGQTTDEAADDFKAGLILSVGSWLHCQLLSTSGGRNFTIQLELERVSEPEEQVE